MKTRHYIISFSVIPFRYKEICSGNANKIQVTREIPQIGGYFSKLILMMTLA